MLSGKQTVHVAIDVPLARTFCYLTDHPLEQGQRVSVLFGHRSVCGIVVHELSTEEIPAEKLKSIVDVLSGVPCLPPCFFAITRFAAAYYHYPLGQTLFTALPTLLRQPNSIRLPDEREYCLTVAGKAMRPHARQKARLRVWQRLVMGPASAQVLRQTTSQAPRLLAEWAKQGWVERVAPERPAFQVAAAPCLNREQNNAVNAVLKSLGQFQPWVLQGVTGSGKTEVYLRLIEAVLRRHEQSMVLVPEINLTPQLIARFTQRFPTTRLAVLHSQLSESERLVAWVEAWQGRAGIIVGTRLSVFVPLLRLGLIIVDEEHDGSFKQHDGLRYHARDLAIWRARYTGVPIVLGSATPSLETVANVDAGRYQRLTLTQRAHAFATLPTIHLLDIRRDKPVEGLATGAISALKRALSQREMSLVYINRRGFAPVIACMECGWLSSCHRCSARLVMHLIERQLRCHHCGWEERVPLHCPECGNLDIKPLGEGTQRVEATLTHLFPEASVVRIDRDTTQRKSAWEQIYRQVNASEVDILVGTQMLVKGHDFGALSVVIVLNADSGLYAADYRASEWLFSQLIQVAGRAGRAAVPGDVFVQTRWPDHPLYQALITHDVDGFATSLLAERRQAGFPPATYQAILRAESRYLVQVMDFLNEIKGLLQPCHPDVMVSGPAPSPMVRVANRERALLVLESSQRSILHTCLDALEALAPRIARKGRGRMRWSLDVDPQEF